jgi:hypothetical protein
VAFNVTSEINRKVSENSFLVNSTSSYPSELVMTSNALLQVTRELPVMHPSFCICSSYSPLFKPYSGGLKVGLLMKNKGQNWIIYLSLFTGINTL